MKIQRIAHNNIGILAAADILKSYAPELPDLSRLCVKGTRIISKAAEKKEAAPPYSMDKLLNLIDQDEYHAGCIDAIAMSTITKFECSHSQVKAWLKAASFPSCEDESTLLTELLKYYIACGNGFFIKMRNSQGVWTGIERLLPNEVRIVERYDDFGFFVPDYIQVRAGVRKDFRYADILHLKKATHRSSAWGLACIPIVISLEILNEIKTYDYNNFKNGLLIDYFMIVEGGSLRDGVVIDENGNEVMQDAFQQIEAALREAKGNAKSHSAILIESESRDVKIKLEPLRQSLPDGGFQTLKKDLRDGIFAYHRVPPRIVSQLVSGQLGGDNNSDMNLFYHFVIKPLQFRLALALANEFNYDFPAWKVLPSHFDFGNITSLTQDDDLALFKSNRNF
ncbi:MAG: phage portal protein [Candidatus Cloacimonetes bacterium]|nr:phage portal protein [Candidatus Cloacimonadota bacterium]